jgi:hypothetical protein
MNRTCDGCDVKKRCEEGKHGHNRPTRLPEWIQNGSTTCEIYEILSSTGLEINPIPILIF